MSPKNIPYGFTLIELLVVVLIIGILAAVALPQYNKAVIKTRYATLKPLVSSVAAAERVYFMANGAYTRSFDELEIDIGGEPRGVSGARYFPWGYCNIENGGHVFCIYDDIQMGYQVLSDGRQICLIYKNKDILHQICKQETGNTPLGSGDNQWYYYK